MKRILIAAVVAGAGVFSLSAAAYSSPRLDEGAGPVRRCQLEGLTVYQRGACAPGELIDAWNLPAVERPERAIEQRQTAESQQSRPAPRPRTAMPDLDVDTWCRAVASAAGGFSQSTFNGCMNREQSAYDDMKGSYARVPRNIRQWCGQVATASAGGSYSTLRGCIMREAEAVSNAPTFQR